MCGITMRRLLALLLLTAATAATASQPARHVEIERVAAFARLYGVVRYFYPSDAAAALDWDRFAVHGVTQVRAAHDMNSLQRVLTDLFAPLGPGLVLGRELPPGPVPGGDDDRLIAWRYFGAGFAAAGTPGAYRGKRTNRAMSAVPSIDGFVTLMQSIPAEAFRGKAIRLRGTVRATATDPSGAAALWLRVDRPDRAVGFFDNMADRPVRDPEWQEYAIEGVVADDATHVAFGVMASGPVTADFDSIELAIRGADGAWELVQIADPGFEQTADSRSEGWSRAGTSKTATITRTSGDAPEGRQYLRFTPPASGAAIAAELFDDARPIEGAHVDVDLGSGLMARVPLTLSEVEASPDPARADRLDAVRQSLAQVREPDGDPEINTRLADIVVAWNVFRHFYPYWPEAGVDWDERLRPHLESAYAATTREAQRDALRRLVADARDGHGRVIDVRAAGQTAFLPLQLASIDGRIVIMASDAPDDAPVGAVVTAIAGEPAARRLAETKALFSGTAQWKEVRALQDIAECRTGAVVELVVDSGAGEQRTRLPCDTTRPPAEKRPDPILETSPGIWYVDLTRANMGQVKPVLDTLARAAAVVFDVRGYPTDAGAGILPHLIDTVENDRWMHVAKITDPFGQSAGWQSFGWNLKPASPRLTGRIVFLTDARAISYAESVMGYVADRKLGTIVGGTTAGTNGNVAAFTVPGAFRITFTGMRVTGHDGHAPFHLVGVRPDVSVEPTIASVREGTDPVLERALELAGKGHQP
jgi:hypothetical protein